MGWPRYYSWPRNARYCTGIRNTVGQATSYTEKEIHIPGKETQITRRQRAVPATPVVLPAPLENPRSAILDGGVLHWQPCRGEKIVRFDFGTRKPGSLNLPPTNCDVNHGGNQLYLVTSSDRKLLKLLAIQGFTMFVW
jgi:hypothetical protein